MSAEVPANSPGLVLDFDFTGGPAAATVLDLSPNQNHGGIDTSYDPFNYPTRVPALAFTGTHPVTLKVEDGKGGVGTQTFNIDVVSQLRGSLTGTVSDSVTHSALEGWTIFVDTNRNNYRDADESFSTTNTKGQYTLSNLIATTSYVAIETMSGFATPAEHTVNIIAGQSITNDFEVTSATPGLIRGRVAVDGVGTAIQGIEVYIDNNKNSVRDDGEAAARTDRLGNYTLSEIGAGVHIVRIDTPAGWSVITPASGSNNVTLAPNGISLGNDFKLNSTAEAVSTPIFVSAPMDKAMARTQFRYAAVAIDPSGRPLTYKLLASPDSMAIDARTGVVVWTPTAKDVGPTRVLLKATNDRGGVVIQDFSLDVMAPNSAPIVTSDNVVSAVVNFPLQFDLLAQDAEQAVLNYSLVSAPSGLSIDAATGRVSWTPTAIQAGLQSAIFRIYDGVGGETRQTLSFNVASANVNGMPVITSGPRSFGQVARNFVGRVSAMDIDNNALTFSLVNGPLGMTITDDGRLNWLPKAAQAGKNMLRVRVVDGRGGSDEQNFNISIDSQLINHAPVLTPVDSALAVVDKIFAENFSASDADGDTLAFQLISGPSGLSLDSTRGTLRWQPAHDQLGVHSVTVRVVDPFGGFDEHTFNMVARNVGGPPAILSIPPTIVATGQTYLYSVQATNTDGDPLTFSLSASPTGMNINPLTGVIAWTPDVTQVGLQTAIVRVRNGVGGFTTQSLSIRVTAGVLNQAPLTSTQPTLDAIVGVPYAYTLRAIDPEGGAITYAVRRGPAGLSIDGSSGVVTWTPTTADLGTAVVVLTATDPGGAAGVLSFLVNVQASNNAPVIVSSAPAKVSQGGLYRYDLIANDLDHEPLTYELIGGPTGMTLDSLGRAKWQTTLDTPLGARSASFTVRDGRGGSVTQTISLSVVADTTPPRVAIIVMNGLLYPWSTEPARVKVTATDDVGVSNITLTLDGAPIALAPDGTTTVFFSAPGNGKLRASAFDAAGNEGKGFAQVSMRSGGEDGLSSPPITTAITSVNNGDEVQGFVTIVGTAHSDDLTDYVLSYRKASESTFHQISRGTSSITAGILGKWDTTLLENDQYVLQLQANDVFGGFASSEREVGVIGDFKLGNFRQSFTDITIPLAGIPITLARTYDTLQADHNGELGYGWSLEFRNANLRNGLAKTGLENLGIYAAFKEGTKVYLTLPGGARQGFTFTPDIRALPGFGNSLIIATPRFTPDRGVRDTLSVRGGTYIVNEFGELMSGGGQPYNPAAEEFGGGYTVTTPEGIRYRIDGNTGMLTTVTDRNNNTLTFTNSGISGPGGTSLTFERDAKGRITKVIDPSGSNLKYDYDANGDLMILTDRMGNISRYKYKNSPAHYLETVIDPLGREGVRAEYGADGKLSTRIDANGNSISTSYDPDNSLVTTRDPLGNPTILEYDSRGNILAKTDAMGNTQRSTFDVNNNELSHTDALGNTTRFTYDVNGNRTTTTDPLGHSSYKRYNTFGQVTEEIDQLGHAQRYYYDDEGNLNIVIDRNDGRTSLVSDSQGNPVSVKDALGASTQFAFDSAGRNVVTTDAEGHVLQTSYNALGEVVGRSLGLPQSDGSILRIANALAYDRNGHAISATDALGKTAYNEYDAVGNLVSRIDELGRRTRYLFNAIGKLTQTIYPDGTSTSSDYDPAGRLISNTDAAGRITRTVYDAVGRVAATIYPDETPSNITDNPTVAYEYDAAGMNTAIVDENGNRTEYHYDAAGRLIETIDSLGQHSLNNYDATGALISTADPRGQKTRWVYDAGGRVTKKELADGSYVINAFDVLGRLVSETDAAGNTTRFSYNRLGQLLSVTDPSGATTTYSYDGLNNRVSQTDANGQTTRFEFDVLGNKTAEIASDGHRSQFRYDSAGNLVETVDFNGMTTHFGMDAMNRVTSQRYDDGKLVTIEYTPTGQRSSVRDENGSIFYAYDARDRLLQRIDSNGQSLAYTYDPAGNQLSSASSAGTVGYSYDSLNRIARVTDGNGRVTRFDYDQSGNVVHTIYANSVSENVSFDALNRITRKTTRSSIGATLSDVQYVYDSTGHRIRANDSFTGVTDYQYDVTGRLISERTTSPHGALSGIDYHYDAVGNRLELNDLLEGTTSYAYDSRNRLQSTLHKGVLESFTYDANGNLLSRTTGPTNKTSYGFDSRGLLVSVDTIRGQSTESYGFTYDVDGNRTSRTVDGYVIHFLIDTNRAHSQVLAALSSDGTPLRSYTYSRNLISQTSGSITLFLHNGSLGTTRLLTDVNGQVVQQYSYDGFGNLLSPNTDLATDHLFTGEPLETALNLIYLRARYFDPTTGRFLGSDPQTGDINVPISLHRFVYASADPVNNSDPTGRATLAEVLTTVGTIATIASIPLSALGFRKTSNALFYISLATGVGGIGRAVVTTGGKLLAQQVAKKAAIVATEAVMNEAERDVASLVASQSIHVLIDGLKVGAYTSGKELVSDVARFGLRESGLSLAGRAFVRSLVANTLRTAAFDLGLLKSVRNYELIEEAVMLLAKATL